MADTAIGVGQGGVVPVGTTPSKASQFIFRGQVLVPSGDDTVGTAVATVLGLETSWGGFLAPVGIAAGSAQTGQLVYYYQPGTTVELPAEVWDTVTGQTGGLTPGAMYYMDTVVAGGLNRAIPTSGEFIVVSVGVAKSATELQIQYGGAGPNNGVG